MFHYIPEGSYRIGISKVEEAALTERGFRFYTNIGVRVVYVQSFWIRTHPVTVAEYLEFINVRGAKVGDLPMRRASKHMPVVGVDHKWASRFAKWKGGRLPTAIEWEVAGRGRDLRPLPWGKEPDERIMGRQEMSPIGSYPDLSSPFGVQEMVGWTSEWTSDIVEGKAITKGSPFNATSAHLADESAYRPSTQMFNVGFRYVLKT